SVAPSGGQTGRPRPRSEGPLPPRPGPGTISGTSAPPPTRYGRTTGMSAPSLSCPNCRGPLPDPAGGRAECPRCGAAVPAAARSRTEPDGDETAPPPAASGDTLPGPPG